MGQGGERLTGGGSPGCQEASRAAAQHYRTGLRENRAVESPVMAKNPATVRGTARESRTSSSTGGVFYATGARKKKFSHRLRLKVSRYDRTHPGGVALKGSHRLGVVSENKGLRRLYDGRSEKRDIDKGSRYSCGNKEKELWPAICDPDQMPVERAERS